MSEENGGTPGSFRESIVEFFNTSNVALIIGSSMVILGAFLNWVENPLVAVTGIGYELGYITIVASIFIMLLSYLNKYRNKRIILSFLSGMIILVVALAAMLLILTEPQVRIGGGLYLTIVGGLIVAIYSVKKYSEFTTRRRAATLVGGTVFLILLAPGIVVSGELIYQYEKLQAEQDLKSLEMEQVTAYDSEEGERLFVVEIEIHNPTNDDISAKINANAENPEFFTGKTYTIPPESTKNIEMRQEDHWVTRGSDLPEGEENASRCHGGQYQGEMSDGTMLYYYKYNCGSVPVISFLPDHEVYDSSNIPRNSFEPERGSW